MDEKEVKKLADSISKSVEELKASIDEKVSAEDLEAKFGAITEKLDGFIGEDGKMKLLDEFTKQQGQLDEIATQIKQLDEYQESKAKSFDEQLDISLKDMLKKDGPVMSRKNMSGKGNIGHMELKASPHLTTDANSGDIETQTEPGVAIQPWRDYPIWSAIRKGTIGAGRDSISWWEEATRGDNAQMITEGTGHDGSGSYKTWDKQSMNIMNLMDFTKISGDMMEDFEYIKSEINDLLSHGIPRKREKELWSGTGSGIYLKGIEQYAKTFAKPANFNKVPVANEADVLRAAILQVNNGYTTDTEKKGYNPNLIMVNPGSIANMQCLKKADGTYILPPFMAPSATQVGGVRIIPNLDLDADEFLVGDFNQAKVYVKRNMRISFHYENGTDVLQDLVLVLASMRLAGVKIVSHAEYAFVTSTFSAAKALIEEVAG